MISRREFIDRITEAVLAGRRKRSAIPNEQEARQHARAYAEDVAKKITGLFPRSLPPVSKKKRPIGRERLRPLYRTTNGRCYYCSKPIPNGGKFADHRDWLIPDPLHQYVREHKTPVSRGGPDHTGNYVPACFRCNRLKQSLTINEYRLLKGFREGNPQYGFPFEPRPELQRDWICVYSKHFEKELLIANMPDAAVAYNNGGAALQ